MPPNPLNHYYNENDPFAAQWLRNLIEAGLIPRGFVDERSIEEVQPGDLDGYAQCHFFAGIAGWPLALRMAGWPEDREIWTGSCPCQPFSQAGKGAGKDDPRHLWPHFFRLISARTPDVVMGEQVAGKNALGWWDEVATDLESKGYTAGAHDLCSAGVSAEHVRQRIYWIASNSNRIGASGRFKAGSPRQVRQGWESRPMDLRAVIRSPFSDGAGFSKPLVLTRDDGVPARVGRIRAYGNAIDPYVAAEVIAAYMDTE